MTTRHPTTSEARYWRDVATVSAIFQLALTAMVAALLATNGADSVVAGYFRDHDAALLVAGGAALLLLARRPLTGRPLGGLSRGQVAMLAAGAAALAYAGAVLVFHHYALTRDEQSAEMASRYFANAHLGWPIPAHLHDLGRAMVPTHGLPRVSAWTSNYLPVNAMIRAPFVLMGDGWLAGPVLLAIGAAALFAAARRIWPDRPHAATVAVVLALSSAQVLMNAATPFAMTGHFALNALWLACFLRGDRRGHAAAIAIGLLASGLHQAHFHIGFVMGFVLWLLMERRWRLAATYAAACLFYWFCWRFAWGSLLDGQLGLQQSWASAPVSAHVGVWLSRLAQLQPGESLSRFIAWQNILLLPLAAVGAAAARRAEGQARILIGCAIACMAGLATMVWQDHGLGYRYLHHLIPCFCLLAAGGWLEIEARMARPLPGALLGTSVAFAALVTLPVTTWRTMAAAAPYEAAYRAARAADADYVVVDIRSGWYIQDIVRFDDGPGRPVLLDLGYVPASALARICAGSRVMLFGERQARHFGVPVDPDGPPTWREVAARAAQLRRLRCGVPMPVG